MLASVVHSVVATYGRKHKTQEAMIVHDNMDEILGWYDIMAKDLFPFPMAHSLHLASSMVLA